MVPVVFQWDWPRWILPKRRMHAWEAQHVQGYINAIVKRDYPYQVRELAGRSMWLEFCEYYAVNPDLYRAMKYM